MNFLKTGQSVMRRLTVASYKQPPTAFSAILSQDGYARVSTDDQNLDLQRDALKAAGCERIFEDMMSGANADPTGLAALMNVLRSE